MFDFIRRYQLDIMLALSATCATFAILLFFTKFLSRNKKRDLILMEFIATFLLFFDRMAYIYDGDLSAFGIVMHRISNLVVYLMTAAIVLGFNMYLEDLLAEEARVPKTPLRLVIVRFATSAEMLLVFLSQFTGFYYYYDEYNIYHRGPGFVLAYVVPVVCPVIQFTVIMHYRRSFSRIVYISLSSFIFVPIAVGILQIFTFGISIVNISLVFVSILLYIFAYLDLNRNVEISHQNEKVELEKEKFRMKKLFDQCANAFMSAVEGRKSYAPGHSGRVARLARKLAESMGKDPRECDDVYYAALLHDIGMMAMPDSVLKREDDLTIEEYELLKQKPIEGARILSSITEYPALGESVIASKERYDGKGYPKGLKGSDIPEISRIVAICDAYDSMMMPVGYSDALPYQYVREEIVKQTGSEFDPEISESFLKLMDEVNFDRKEDELSHIDKELLCKDYKGSVTAGIPVSVNKVRLSFKAELKGREHGLFSEPVLIVFDSYDRHIHSDPKAVEAYQYIEYGELWFDGHFVSTAARKLEVRVAEPTGLKTTEHSYIVTAARFEDHMSLIMEHGGQSLEAVIAMPDRSGSVYLALTGENCRIYDIAVEHTGEKVEEGDIRKIASEINYTGRMEADLPNIQIDNNRSAASQGVRVEDGLRIDFHSMSLPSANLVWHCPYVVLFFSNDGRVNGEGYREYALVKINGEAGGVDKYTDSSFSLKKKDGFPGWNTWKEKCKEGIECSVAFKKSGRKLQLSTENMGLKLDYKCEIRDGSDTVYVALTGDQVALTDIRIRA
ncbi:HD-GYP domain-containing protein [Butyrivibrio sp. MC2013]|uniref:HD-GYP domain-containing protein n=1 Tax=Butyrivibrio sp. MC2013 TaxID=1280686 RepID=UPI000428931D|nr:HD domain-containing phosphohydrolase [Butyrivibrio sp. MC2013]